MKYMLLMWYVMWRMFYWWWSDPMLQVGIKGIEIFVIIWEQAVWCVRVKTKNHDSNLQQQELCCTIQFQTKMHLTLQIEEAKKVIKIQENPIKMHLKLEISSIQFPPYKWFISSSIFRSQSCSKFQTFLFKWFGILHWW